MPSGDDRLRDALRQATPHVPLRDVHEVLLQKRRSYHLRRRVGSALLTFAVIAGSVAGFAALRHVFADGPRPADSETPSPSFSPAPSLTGRARITAEIPLPTGSISGGMAVDAGSAWLGLDPDEPGGDNAVMRIDLATNRIVAQIPVQEGPYRKRIAATDDAVWVASHGVLERIDPATNAVVARVQIPDRQISAITADPADVWAVTIDPSSGGVLVRVDAVTNTVVAEIPLGPQITGYEDEVLIGAGSIWIVGVTWIEREDAEYGSDLIRVDPATNGVSARIPVGAFSMVMADDAVWVRFPADGVFDASPGESWLWAKVDVGTNEVSRSFTFQDNGLQLVTPEALWSVGYAQNGDVYASRFDPETLELASRSERVGPVLHDAVLDPDSGTIWVSAFYEIVRLDIR
jgi:DNA-binding beta-propeller fold protein YncE